MYESSIICIGNRFVQDDAAGLAVYDKLQEKKIPIGLQVVEGGLAGLNLLPLLEKAERIVFVDAISGFATDQNIIVLDQPTLLQKAHLTPYGHEAGLPYLLAVLPYVIDGELPEEIILVGLQGKCDSQVIDQAALLSIQLATSGMRAKNAQENT